jgi:hypothetical protein
MTELFDSTLADGGYFLDGHTVLTKDCLQFPAVSPYWTSPVIMRPSRRVVCNANRVSWQTISVNIPSDTANSRAYLKMEHSPYTTLMEAFIICDHNLSGINNNTRTQPDLSHQRLEASSASNKIP